MKPNFYKIYGQALMADAMGSDLDRLQTKEAEAQTLSKSGAWNVAVCGLARDIFDRARGPNSLQSNFARETVKRAAAGDQDAQFVAGLLAESVQEALGATTVCKQAGTGSWLPKAWFLGARTAPTWVKTILAGAATTGAGVGSLAWLLNRHGKQDALEVQALQDRADSYERMSREIENKLRRKGVDLDNEEGRAGLARITGTDHIVFDTPKPRY
jgi:hypothetical protein